MKTTQSASILRFVGPVGFDVVHSTPDSVRVVKEGFVSCDCPACGDAGMALGNTSVHERGHSAEQLSARLGGELVIVCSWCGHRFDTNGQPVKNVG